MTARGHPSPDVHALRFGCCALLPLFFVATDAWLLGILVPLLAGRVGRLWHRAAHG